MKLIIRYIFIEIIMASSINIFAQCPSNNTVDMCSGGNGPISDNTNLNTSDKYYWNSGVLTVSNVNFGGGTLVVCGGTLNITSGNFNGGTIIVMGGVLNINFDVGLNNSFTIINYSTINFNSNLTLQGAPAQIFNNSGGTINVSGQTTINGSSQFINNSTFTTNNLVLQTNSGTTALCQGAGAQTNVNNNFNNNTANSIQSPNGPSCIYIGNDISLSQIVSPHSDLLVCDAPGGNYSGVGWGNATVYNNCSDCNAPLPVELLYFIANPRDSYVELQWKVASQINNDYFVVERSKDAKDWEQLVMVKGAGTTSIPMEYLETDPSPYEGLSYYRLKQVDFDGSFTYSQIVSVYYKKFLNASIQEPIIYPNPVSSGNSLNIQFPAWYTKALVVLRDMQGKEVFSKVIVFEENNLLYAFPIDNTIQPGIYLVVASSNRNILFSKKVIVK